MADKMDNFKADMDVVLNEIRGVMEYYGLKEWREYLLIRLPGKAGSFVVFTHPKDQSAFADQIVQLHQVSAEKGE